MDLAVVDGKPMWKERGADTFNPFSSGKGGAVFKASGVTVANNSYTIVPITAYDESTFLISNNMLTCKKAGTLHYLITSRNSHNRNASYIRIYQNGSSVGAFREFNASTTYNSQCWTDGSVSVVEGDTIQVRLTSEGDNAATDARYGSGMIIIV